jgi:hypothetical protein
MMPADNPWTTARNAVDNRHPTVDSSPLCVDRTRPSVEGTNHHI